MSKYVFHQQGRAWTRPPLQALAKHLECMSLPRVFYLYFRHTPLARRKDALRKRDYWHRDPDLLLSERGTSRTSAIASRASNLANGPAPVSPAVSDLASAPHTSVPFSISIRVRVHVEATVSIGVCVSITLWLAIRLELHALLVLISVFAFTIIHMHLLRPRPLVLRNQAHHLDFRPHLRAYFLGSVLGQFLDTSLSLKVPARNVWTHLPPDALSRINDVLLLHAQESLHHHGCFTRTRRFAGFIRREDARPDLFEACASSSLPPLLFCTDAPLVRIVSGSHSFEKHYIEWSSHGRIRTAADDGVSAVDSGDAPTRDGKFARGARCGRPRCTTPAFVQAARQDQQHAGLARRGVSGRGHKHLTHRDGDEACTSPSYPSALAVGVDAFRCTPQCPARRALKLARRQFRVGKERPRKTSNSPSTTSSQRPGQQSRGDLDVCGAKIGTVLQSFVTIARERAARTLMPRALRCVLLCPPPRLAQRPLRERAETSAAAYVPCSSTNYVCAARPDFRHVADIVQARVDSGAREGWHGALLHACHRRAPSGPRPRTSRLKCERMTSFVSNLQTEWPDPFQLLGIKLALYKFYRIGRRLRCTAPRQEQPLNSPFVVLSVSLIIALTSPQANNSFRARICEMNVWKPSNQLLPGSRTNCLRALGPTAGSHLIQLHEWQKCNPLHVEPVPVGGVHVPPHPCHLLHRAIHRRRRRCKKKWCEELHRPAAVLEVVLKPGLEDRGRGKVESLCGREEEAEQEATEGEEEESRECRK
ncbi:hypothetical protein C8R45DRAFT_935038 [Mycena sanguinolenta]|nr:hypothetical protein C8R45DRAFT_935038 [Mycena sanguinolenta]